MRWMSRSAALSTLVGVAACGPNAAIPPFDEALLAGVGPVAAAPPAVHAVSSTRTEWRCVDGRPVLFVLGKVTLRNRTGFDTDGLRLVDRTELGVPDRDLWTGIGGGLEVPLSRIAPDETIEYEYEYAVLGQSPGGYRHSVWVSGPEGDGGTENVTVSVDILSIEPPVDLCAVTCTVAGDYWRIHGPGASAPSSNRWPVESLTLGTRSYAGEEIRGLLGNPERKGDPVGQLVRGLITAKLNIAAGADPGDVAAVIRAADALIGNRDLRADRREPGDQMSATTLAAALAEYNAGRSGPGACGSGSRRLPGAGRLRSERVGIG